MTGTAALKARIPGLRSAISAASGGAADDVLAEGDVVKVGSHALRVLATPGHTAGCISLVLDDDAAVFTGDALLVRGCGRTDFQGGSAETLYASTVGKLFHLRDDCIVYTGHDYNGHTSSTIGEEKRHNPRLTKDLPAFVALMGALGLPRPKLIDVAVPANLADGAGLPVLPQ